MYRVFAGLPQKVKEMSNLSNVLAIVSIGFSVLKVKVLSILLPLDQSDQIFYLTYILLVAPNILSFGISVDVYKANLSQPEMVVNRLFNRHVVLMLVGFLVSVITLAFLKTIPLFSLIGFLTVLNIVINIPIGSIDTLIGLKKGPVYQHILNLTRSNLWLMLFIPLYLGKGYLSIDYNEIFLLAYLSSSVILLAIYKTVIGRLGEISWLNYSGFFQSKGAIQDVLNNVLIQNKEYFLGFVLRTFILSRLNINGLLIFMSIFDILITVATSFANNAFLKNYGKAEETSRNIQTLKFLFTLFVGGIFLINLFNAQFVFVIIGDYNQEIQNAIIYFSVYAVCRFAFIAISQMILISGNKTPWELNLFSFIYILILVNAIPSYLCLYLSLFLALVEVTLIYKFFKKVYRNVR